MSGSTEEESGPIELAPRPAEVTPAPSPAPAAAPVSVEAKGIAAPPAAPRPPLWEVPAGAGRRGWLVAALLVALLAIYAWTLSSYYAGAHGGVDQNGYLMTARLLAGEADVGAPRTPATAPATALAPAAAPATSPALDPHHPPLPTAAGLRQFEWLRNRLSFVPVSPWQFAGRMCIMTEPYGPPSTTQPANYRIYAKYPPGFPALAAIAREIGGWSAMYLVNPLCTLLACYFAYFLFRLGVGPFMSVIGVVWLACNPLVLNYANDANSHASTLFCVTVGMWGLLSWLRRGGVARGLVGGLALGYACTIRYSEFLLLLPVLFAAGARFRFRWRPALESVGVVAAWALPVGLLAAVCWVCFGSPWKTGYTYCNESTGFAWKYLSGDMGDAGPLKQGNWETLLLQLNRTGLFLLWPFALAGLFGLMASSWRLGVTLALWILPATLLYMLYYWAPTSETTVGYLRFFMSVMPGFIFAGLWVVERGLLAMPGEKRGALVVATLAGAGILLVAALVGLGEAPVVGVGIVGQAARGLWQMLSGGEGWPAAMFGWLVPLLVGAMWFFERDQAAGRAALALGAGALTALGCGVNLYNIAPTIEAAQGRWLALRETVNEVRAHLPRGSVLFTGTTRFNDQVLNQMDAVGGYELYSLTLFEPASFTDAKRRVDNGDKDSTEPDPVQVERERYYMELLGRQNARGAWIVKSPAQLRQAAFELQDKLLAEGRQIGFLSNEGSKGLFPLRPGYELREITRWAAPPAVPTGMQARVQAKAAVPRHAAAFTVLYELVKKAPGRAVEKP